MLFILWHYDIEKQFFWKLDKFLIWKQETENWQWVTIARHLTSKILVNSTSNNAYMKYSVPAYMKNYYYCMFLKVKMELKGPMCLESWVAIFEFWGLLSFSQFFSCLNSLLHCSMHLLQRASRYYFPARPTFSLFDFHTRKLFCFVFLRWPLAMFMKIVFLPWESDKLRLIVRLQNNKLWTKLRFNWNSTIANNLFAMMQKKKVYDCQLRICIHVQKTEFSSETFSYPAMLQREWRRKRSTNVILEVDERERERTVRFPCDAFSSHCSLIVTDFSKWLFGLSRVAWSLLARFCIQLRARSRFRTRIFADAYRTSSIAPDSFTRAKGIRR